MNTTGNAKSNLLNNDLAGRYEGVPVQSGITTVEEIYTREHVMDDVYLKRIAPVFRPNSELKRLKPVSHFARNSVALAMAFTLMVTSVGATYGKNSMTGAFMADTEISSVNVLIANLLDFLVGSDTLTVYIEGGETIPLNLSFTLEPNSEITEYLVTAENFGGSANFCAQLNGTVTSPPFDYDGALTVLSGSPTTHTGNWILDITMPDVNGILDGETCTFDLVHHGWNSIVPDDTGYFDDEVLSITVIFEAGEPEPDLFDIVLNEFLPNPDNSANGLDFGNDSSNMPDGEWIELYNKGPVPIDVLGWYMTDASGGVGNTHAFIGPTNTNTGNTIIPAGGWIVIYLNKPSLNNTGDDIYLYTSTTTGNQQIDAVSYDDPSDGCTLEPTPGDDNVDGPVTGTPGNGPNADCPQNQIAPNKSYARIPDGTGPWIDPIPTPGAPNILDEPLASDLESTSQGSEEDSVDESSALHESQNTASPDSGSSQEPETEAGVPTTPDTAADDSMSDSGIETNAAELDGSVTDTPNEPDPGTQPELAPPPQPASE